MKWGDFVKGGGDDHAAFAGLADTTKRVAKILKQMEDVPLGVRKWGYETYHANEGLRTAAAVIDSAASKKEWEKVIMFTYLFMVGSLSTYFEDVLVIDHSNLHETRARRAFLRRCMRVLTRYYDFRELMGQASVTHG